ncbi:VOC family protein [Tsuneonella sp. HG222]
MGRQEDRGAFVWYELMTDDPAGAKAFYDAVVGWNLQAEGNRMPNGSEYRMIGRSDGGNAGGVLAITPAMAGHGTKPGWFPYIHSPDVDATCQALTEAGGTVHMAPSDMGVGRIAMVADPWDAVFYVMDPQPPAGDPDAKSDVFAGKPQHVRWNDLWSPDPAKAAALYGELFGWRQEGSMPMGEQGDYLFLYRGEGMIGAAGPATPGGRGPRWDIYIGVDDIDRAAQAVEAGGGKLTGEIQQIPGGDYSVHAQDPQGAAFGLVGPRKE